MEEKNLKTEETGAEKKGKSDKRLLSVSFDLLSKYRGMLMGIAILGIMFLHYTEDIIDTANWFESNYKLYIGSSFVDVFLILSGISLYYSVKKAPDITAFYEKRFTRVLIPYVLIAGPVWFCIDILINGTGPVQFLKDFLFITFFEDGTRPFWYILMICFCYLIFPALFQLFEAASDHVTEYLYFICIFTFFTVIALMFQNNDAELYANIKIALLRLPAFCGGCLIGKMAYEKRPVPKYAYGIMAASVFLEWLGVEGKTMVAYYTKGLFTFSLCLLLIILLEFLSRHWEKIVSVVRKTFAWVGRYTLELYLLHVGIRELMKLLGAPMENREWTLLLWAVSFALAVPIHWLANQIIVHLRLAAPASTAG